MFDSYYAPCTLSKRESPGERNAEREREGERERGKEREREREREKQLLCSLGSFLLPR
jgi:hypothetical protein